jgi:hypothetical protein
MQFDPSARLRRNVERMKIKGTCSPIELVDILRVIRLILEKGKTKEVYPTLSFYCDWVLHSELDRNPKAHALLCELDRALVSILKETDMTKVTSEISNVLSIDKLRKDIISLFKSNSIDPVLFSIGDNWTAFINALTNELLSRPITYPPDVRTNPKAKGHKLFLQAVKHREDNLVRSDIKITSAMLTQINFGPENQRSIIQFELSSTWENSEAGVNIHFPLIISKRDDVF